MKGDVERTMNGKVLLLIVGVLMASATAYAANPPMCPHVIYWGGGIATWAQGAPWIKVIGSGEIPTAQACSPNVFYRPYDADPQYHDDGCLPASLTGSQYADLVWAKISGLARKPEAIGYRNEFNWSSNPTEHKRTCREFVNYKNRLRQLGYQGMVVFGSFGVGWVDSEIWDDPDVRAATDAADAIETHEYFDLEVSCCAPWLAFRHRDIAIANHPDHLGNKPWFIGEFGSDRVCGNCTSCDDDLCRRGWRDNGKLSEQAYINQLSAYRAGCADQVVAVFVFQQGSGNWWDFETMGTSVADWMKSTWTVQPGAIAGNVKNSGGQNLSGAVVTTNTGGYSATTDANGNYIMTGVSPGTYNVTASKSGYQSQTQTGKTVNSNQTTTVNFTLTPSSGTELLTNGSFDNGCTGWSHSESPSNSYWGCGYKAYPGTSSGNGGHSWNAFLACGGWFCDLAFTGELHQDNVPVVGGQTYNASAQVYYEPVAHTDPGDQKERIVLIFNNGTTHYGTWHTHVNGNGWDQITLSGTIPSGATSMTFKVELSHVDSQWSGTGAVDECSFISQASGCTPPSITTHPQSQTKCVGQSVTFTVVASGTTPLSYQWKKNGVDISGATSSSYTISTVTTADAGSYTCYVSNACGNVTSNAATLTVNTPPSITTQPSSQTKTLGQSVTFTVAASGTTPLSYQWRKNGSNISGATSSSYTISYVKTSDAGNYDCVVSNTCGSATSNTATLTVNPITQNFDSMPSWNSTFNASWGSAATWSIVSGGQSGNYLQASRSSQGSSARVLVYTVPPNTTLTVSVYMKCPSFGGTYWMESAYKLGNYSAQDFDQNSGTWTLIQKFANSGYPNGNGNTWTNYSVNVNTGSNTQISIGYKLGSSGGAGPTVGWDTFKIQ